ncbi:hypothetical protein IAR55_004005 [Kwoniella newhampshirensis]|uniref:Uncharacterized protein n=1 Tax=Kwoniella newhampshirensis TaxID=1651941 RepID=A0AAW0YYS8_9TREE
MRLPHSFLVMPLLLAGPAVASLFGGDSATISASPSSPSSTSTSSGGSTQSSNSEVAFLQTLQTAQIASMSCLITLVNMTTTPIGTCLGLTSLADLIADPNHNGSTSFSDQVNTYLGGVCGQTCAEGDLQSAKAQLEESCDSSKDNGLVGVLGKVLDNYSTSYRTVACQVHFNGTSSLCLPDALDSSQAANSDQFFDDLVTGTNLDQYKDSVFTSAKCTGCMYELFKAAQYTIPSIRGSSLTNAFGDHLKNDCPNDPTYGSAVNWADVEDQQIPDSLQVSQNTNQTSSSASATIVKTRMGLGLGLRLDVYKVGWVLVGLLRLFMAGCI